MSAEEFKKLGITVVRGIFSDTEKLYKYTKGMERLGDSDVQTPGAPAFYKDVEMSKLQMKILRKMEEATGLELYPTYNYFRVYNNESILKKHRDRPACEISITMCIGYDGDYNWPVCVTDYQGRDHIVTLEPGDGLIYRGCDLTHWREPADERVKKHSQVFIHYVDANGPHANCVFDIGKVQ